MTILANNVGFFLLLSAVLSREKSVLAFQATTNSNNNSRQQGQLRICSFLQSARASPYQTVGTSGASWNGQTWEGASPSWEQHFQNNRQAGFETGRGKPVTSVDPESNGYAEEPEHFAFSFPRETQTAPLVRYNSLSEDQKMSLADPYTSPNPNQRMNNLNSDNNYRKGDYTNNGGYGTSPSSPYGYGHGYGHGSTRNPVQQSQSQSQSHRPRSTSVPMPEAAQQIQGNSRGTWSSQHSHEHDRVRVVMETDGRPLQADIEVYQGPDNVPQKMRIFSEDGRTRPFVTTIETPSGNGGGSHSISVKNTGPMEFPIVAGVEGTGQSGATLATERSARMSDYAGRSTSSFLGRSEEIHGGNLKTYPFDPSVGSVEISINSQGLPIMARIELWQGPGDVKTIAQVYSDDGLNKPFSAIIETPGAGNTIAIRNVGPQVYPIEAMMEVYSQDNSAYSYSYGAGVAGAGTQAYGNTHTNTANNGYAY